MSPKAIASAATALVEGLTDQIFLNHVAGKLGLEVSVEVAGGKPTLLQRLPAYSKAADYAPFIILVDLDQDQACAPEFVAMQPYAGKFLCLRVAVRSLESWLMADRENFASFFGVRISRVPVNPDIIADPKDELTRLVRTSRKLHVRRDVLPVRGGRVGPGYTSVVQEFLSDHWNMEQAARTSASLGRSIKAIRNFALDIRKA